MEIWQVVLFAVSLSFNISVIQSNNWGLRKVGYPSAFLCNSSNAIWSFGNKEVANCGKCEKPTCQVDANFESRINATCNNENHSSQLNIAYLKSSDSSKVRCGKKSAAYYELFVGDYSKHLRPEGNSLLALDQSSFTLVCDRDYSSEMVWYAKGKEIIGSFRASSCDNSASPPTTYSSRLHFSCDKKTKVMKLKIDPIRFSLDDRVNIACRDGDKLAFFDLNVRVPVENVTIKYLNQTGFVEGRREKFYCVGVRSKPAASIWWFLTYQNGSEIRIVDSVWIETTQIKNVFQTVSTLELVLNREYRNIMCQARIENTEWKKSPSVPLEIKYAPNGIPVIIVRKPVLFAGDQVEINCEWNGGIPEATLKLSCLSKYKEGKASVTIEGYVTENMDGTICQCDGIHIERNESAMEKINVLYAPKGNPVINVGKPVLFPGDQVEINCEWNGGIPEATLELSCLSKYKEGNASVTIEGYVTEDMDGTICQCDGIHIERNESAMEKINVFYAPKGNPVINIGKPVLFPGDQVEINCEWNGGIPEATLELSCLSKYEKGKASVTIEVNVTEDMDGTICQCDGIHVERNESVTENINVIYTPEMTVVVNATVLDQRAYLRCEVQTNPTKFVYKIVQKWGNTIKREIDNDSVEFPSFSLEDFGTWVCRVSNEAPMNDYYAEQSVELQMPVHPLMKGRKAETAMFGERKSLKLCFYCYPEATDVKWFKNGEFISSLKYSEEPADDGIFPFYSNCSVLEVNTEDQKLVHNFALVVTNSVGQSSLPVVLLIDPPDSIKPILYPAVICVLGTILVSLIIVSVTYRRTEQPIAATKRNINQRRVRNIDLIDYKNEFVPVKF